MKTLLIFPMLLWMTISFAQDKVKARVSASYSKIMNQESFVNISAKYKGENGFEPASNLAFHVYQKVSDDSLRLIGNTSTNANGKVKFLLDNQQHYEAKSGGFHFVVKIENDSHFQDAETEINVADATLIAALETVDSVNQIVAKLLDAKGNPVKGQSLKVQLQRIYAPLPVGAASYETDENGSITVPIVDRMPGIDGNLNYEVVLEESDLYGTIKVIVSTHIGIPISDQSTFDSRTLWSPPSKTPYYLLLFPNLIIVGVWLPILILIINLYRISKTKTKTKSI